MASSSVVPVHLLTLVHGMWGEPAHVARMGAVMEETYPTGSKTSDFGYELNVLIAETNKEAHTYDGVDWGAERVVQEIKKRIEALESEGNKKVTRFSIVGYSLGGLLARYTVGILGASGFFDAMTPINFATVATPNIGLLRYPTFLSTVQNTFGPIMLSRTGTHFWATDDWSDGKPLLEAMSESGGVFYETLVRFRHVTFYANAVNDLTVPFVTAAAESFDPFVADGQQGIEIDLDEKYAPIVKSFKRRESVIVEKGPKRFSKEWFKAKWNKPSNLPPPLQARFPFNLVIYASLPLLIPLFLILVTSNFTYNVFHSKRRIRLLESSGQGNRGTIMELMQSLERGVEDAVIEMMDDGPNDADPMSPLSTEPSTAAPTRNPSRTGTPANNASSPKSTKARRQSITYVANADPHSHADRSSSESKNQPILKPTQVRMIANLNTLPNLKKEYVFLDGMRNSHATIVCRDLKKFAFHDRGEGVLRHLADHFEL